MEINEIRKTFVFNKHFNVVFLKDQNVLVVRGVLGVAYFFLPSYHHYLKNKNNMVFIFITMYYFKSFLAHYFAHYIYSNVIYFVRLRMKGLGYTMRKISDNLFSFCFFYINYCYVYIPLNIISKWYRKRAIFIGNNLVILNMLLKNILLLKKVGPYRILGLRYPKQLMVLKKK